MGRITKYKTNLNIFLGKTDAHMLRNDLFAAIHPSGIAHFIKELCCAKEENLNLLIILLIKALVKSLGHFFLPWATIAEIIGSILDRSFNVLNKYSIYCINIHSRLI